MNNFFAPKYDWNVPVNDVGRGDDAKSAKLSDGNEDTTCVVFPGNVSVVADTIERKKLQWFVNTDVANNLIIHVGCSRFHLHKLPMVARSEYLNRLVFERSESERYGAKIKIDYFPGGADIFELVVKFCYGWRIDLTADNIALVYCAAKFLKMSDDLEEGNLISKAEAFLSFLFFTSWKDIFRIFKSCEAIPSWAKQFQVLERCCETVAWKICMGRKAFPFGDFDDLCLNVKADSAESCKLKSKVECWRFDDVSGLRVDHFVEMIDCLKKKGVSSEVIGSCVAEWTAIWLSKFPSEIENIPKSLMISLLKVSIESLIKVLPEEENSVSCNFLLRLLKLGNMTRTNVKLTNRLQERISLVLEKCKVSDLLVRNFGNNDCEYDVNVVIRVLETYVSSVIINASHSQGLLAVGRLVDGYLTLVARDAKLAVKQFQSLAKALPEEARLWHDNLYRAIDVYLKVHPTLTDEERTSICRALDYHKLSQDAHNHIMKNDRLPLQISTRMILLEQVNMATTAKAMGSNCLRTKAQATIRGSKSLKKNWVAPRSEITVMKRDVADMKMQLNELEKCKLQLQRQLKTTSVVDRKKKAVGSVGKIATLHSICSIHLA